MFKSFDAVKLGELVQNIIRRDNQDFSVREPSDLDLRLVGQEKNGILLLSWKQPTRGRNIHTGLVQTTVSAIGTYDLKSQHCKVVYIHETDTDIINATISEQQTFVGFITKHQQEASGSQGKRYMKDVHRAYLAEINPQNRVFYLNLERENYIMLQFLYGEYKCYNVANELHLLVILHRDSLGLYHLPQVYDETKGWILGAEPKKEQILFKNILWVEWDFMGQRLYVLYQNKSRLTGSVRKNLLSCYQFAESLLAHDMLELSLELPIPVYDEYSELGNAYYEAGAARVIPDVYLNLRVLSKKNGILCICYQHMNHGPCTTISTPLPATGSNISSSGCQARKHEQTADEYSIILVHKKRTICCRRFTTVCPFTYHIYFFWCGNYIAAHVPECWTHLLNIETDNPLLHNIIWRDPDWNCSQTTSSHSRCNAISMLGYYNNNNKLEFQLYQNQQLYLMKLNLSTIHQMFSSQPPSRVALLHLAVVHIRDLSLIKKLFDVICEENSQDTVELFKEFLIGSAYVHFCSIAPKWASQLVPCTTSPNTNSAITVPISNKILLDFIKYSMKRTNVRCLSAGKIYLKVTEIHGKHSTHTIGYRCGFQVEKQSLVIRSQQTYYKYWAQLFNSLSLSSTSPNLRFIPTTLRQTVYRSLHKPMKTSHQSSNNETASAFFDKVKSFFGKMQISNRRCPASSDSNHQVSSQREASAEHNKEKAEKEMVESLFGKQPKFLGLRNQSASCQQSMKFVSDYIHRQQPSISVAEAYRLGQEYTECQMYYSSLLVHIISSVIQPTATYDIVIKGSCTTSEMKLFKMLERYYLAAEQLLYPTPPGLADYFLALGYRCLHLNMFLQYIDNKVLILTTSFVQRIIKSLDDDCYGVEVKFQLISRLPQTEALKCLLQWSHPQALQHFSYFYASEILSSLSDDLTGSCNVSSSRDPDDQQFTPLSLIISLIERQSSQACFPHTNTGDKNGLRPDTQLLKETALSAFK